MRINEDLISIWQAVNPRLPLISDKAIQRKVKDLLNLVKDINRKHAKVRAKSNLGDKLDKLFDISACTCSLEMVPCNDVRVKCTASNCIQDHFLCICATNAKVPPEERAYLRDQRLKIGPKGTFQMASVDRAAAKKALAAEKRLQKHDQGACEEGTVSPKQLEYSESISSSSSSSIQEVSRMELYSDFFA